MKVSYLPLRKLPDGIRPKRTYSVATVKVRLMAEAVAHGHMMGRWREGRVAYQDDRGFYRERGSALFSCHCRRPGCLAVAVLDTANPLQLAMEIQSIEERCPTTHLAVGGPRNVQAALGTVDPSSRRGSPTS